MNILETYYTYATISQVAYIDLSSKGLNPSVADIVSLAKSQERVPEAITNNFFGVNAIDSNYWTMLYPYYKTSTDTGHSDPSSGFAAMLLSNPTYGKVLSIAGTEPTAGVSQFLDDLLYSDIGQIGLLGGALAQVVSLFNYVQELKAPAGTNNVLRLELHAETYPPAEGTPYIKQGTINYYWLEAHYDGQGQGLIAQGEQLTVTGHSLGGHVAALAVALFPETFTTAYTFNAPGYNPLSSQGVQSEGVNGLLNLFKQFGVSPLTVGSSTFTDRVITLEAEDAIPGDDNEIVSSSATGSPFSPEVYITTEKVTHDIGHMTESLALQYMFSQLDPSITVATAGNILPAVTAQPLETYEKLLQHLNLLLTGTPITLEVTGPSTLDAVAAGGGDFAIRNTFFDSYFGLQANAAFKDLIGKVEITAPPTTGSAARTDLGAFLSLYYLTPFAFKIQDAGALNSFYETHASIAALWNDDRNLSPEQIANGEANYSDTWLNDRAALLNAIIKANTIDKDTITGGNAPDNTDYTNLGTNTTIHVVSEVLGFPSTAPANHITFGDMKNNTITGGDKGDHLYGGNGQDIPKVDAGEDMAVANNTWRMAA